MRKWTCLLMIVLLLLSANGCSMLNRNDAQEPPPENGDRLPLPDASVRETVFYLPAENWQVLVPVRKHIPWEEGIARATLNYMVEGQVPQDILALGLKPLLPAGTEVLGLSIRDGLARVDLSEDVLKFNPDHARMVIYGLVYTLTEFPTIHKVEILVAGTVPDLPGGIYLGEPLSRDAGLNLEVAEDVDDFSNTQRVTLYFLYPVPDSVLYAPVTRVVSIDDELPLTVANELLRGPAPGSPLFTALPQGIDVQSITTDGGKVILHVDGDFSVTGGGQRAADRVRHQLALTFTEISGVMDVEVRANGTTPQFPPGVHFPASFDRPKQWNLVGSVQ